MSTMVTVSSIIGTHTELLLDKPDNILVAYDFFCGSGSWQLARWHQRGTVSKSCVIRNFLRNFVCGTKHQHQQQDLRFRPKLGGFDV